MSLQAFLISIGLAAGISVVGLGAYMLCLRVFHFAVEIALWVYVLVVLFILFLVLQAGVIK